MIRGLLSLALVGVLGIAGAQDAPPATDWESVWASWVRRQYTDPIASTQPGQWEYAYSLKETLPVDAPVTFNANGTTSFASRLGIRRTYTREKVWRDTGIREPAPDVWFQVTLECTAKKRKRLGYTDWQVAWSFQSSEPATMSAATPVGLWSVETRGFGDASGCTVSRGYITPHALPPELGLPVAGDATMDVMSSRSNRIVSAWVPALDGRFSLRSAEGRFVTSHHWQTLLRAQLFAGGTLDRGPFPGPSQTWSLTLDVPLVWDEPDAQTMFEWHEEITRETGQPPQLVTTYVRDHPYFRDAIREAASFVNMDVNVLAGLLMSELHVAAISSRLFDGGTAARGELDSWYEIGLDSFAVDAPRLLAQGYLHRDVKYEVGDVQTNEINKPVAVVWFHNLRETVLAFAAVLRSRQDRARAYLRSRGITKVSIDEDAVVTYAFYNVANPSRFLDSVRRRGPLARIGFQAPSWRENLRRSLGTQNTGRALANVRMFRRAQVLNKTQE